ncbi:hypothetical protein L6164_025337 [Bauhinia variegata]|uniref:Uncharacterized protein n=1 Tax=Bauhinia variegata TaxID=167791 RepID=A0ACB9M0F1_BAUVA|nr:hypothetical protein L6164_025337 [Bauhinia variegata]
MNVEKDLGSGLKPNREKKKKHKERKNKHESDEVASFSEISEENCNGEAAEAKTIPSEGDMKIMMNGEKESKRKKRKKGKEGRDNNDIANGNTAIGEVSALKPEPNADKVSTKVVDTEVDHEDRKKIKRKKKKLYEQASNGDNVVADTERTSKRVTFSDKVEVLNDGLIRGKRFTPEEDKKIKEAVFNYIESHGLGDEGLNMVLHCKSHKQVKNCWKEIGASLPLRPWVSVYYRAHILFERDENRKWTPEEYELIQNYQQKHGSDWKVLAEAMGKHRIHVKDTWRRLKVPKQKKGNWSQEEYQNLFDLVNMDLRMRAEEEYRKSKHGMLRDNIPWEAISSKLETRSNAHCCIKWYSQLTSPMVSEGMWSDTDDYRLLNALFTLDASCMEEVDWDHLLEHRSGDVCRKRWNQIVQHIGEHGNKSFAEQVEILSKRYCPDLVEAREAFDGKPVVT